ncbi:hypothetical protein [Desulfovibrio inopinatus]|uniref:hypothetical protein n=1 Tax=Desulfovibrio inopinatus TaxID=102109 RepID=UPI000408B455|nr:hypothetical protein [Desulfovibrio inopinatus]
MTTTISSSVNHILTSSSSLQTDFQDVENVSQQDQNNTKSSEDTVSISKKGRALQTKSTGLKNTNAVERWARLFGFVEGEHSLDNGGSQVISIEGSGVEIQEYDKDGRLVKKIHGALDGDRAVLDTEIYGLDRNISQTIHVEVSGLHDALYSETTAKISRTVSWYDEAGEVSRQMRDSIELETTYSKRAEGDHTNVASSSITKSALQMDSLFDLGKVKQNVSLEDLSGTITNDTQNVNYSVEIQDYVNGQLRQELKMGQDLSFHITTNRSSTAYEGQDPHTSSQHSSSSSNSHASLTNYDEDGKIVSSMRFNNGDGTRESPSDIEISLYEDGVIAYHGSGYFSSSESIMQEASDTMSFFQTFHIDQESYADTTPLAASEILSGMAYEASTEDTFFEDTLGKNVLKSIEKKVDMLKSVDEIASEDAIYDFAWTEEGYKNGELLYRQEDTASSRLESIEGSQGTSTGGDYDFTVGGRLTKEDKTVLLHESSHHYETYENNILKSDVKITGSEYVKENEDGSYELRSKLQTERRDGVLNRQHNDQDVAGPLEEVDGLFHNVEDDISGQLQVLLDGLTNTITNLTSVKE